MTASKYSILERRLRLTLGLFSVTSVLGAGEYLTQQSGALGVLGDVLAIAGLVFLSLLLFYGVRDGLFWRSHG